MITEANQYEVMALTKQLDRQATRFSAFSIALSIVRSAGDAASVSKTMRAEQYQFDKSFGELATLLGYTVAPVPSPDGRKEK